jgi:hypothetical protein
VELGDISLQPRDLVADDPEESAQRAAGLNVAELVDGGQQVIEPVVGHYVTSCRMRVSFMASER